MSTKESEIEKDLTQGVDSLSIINDPNTTAETTNSTTTKVDILLNATGNVAIMKKKRWAVDQEKSIGWIMKFVHKYLKLSSEEKLFLYVNQTFAPSPDQIVKNLFECYQVNGKLVLYYSKSQAWG